MKTFEELIFELQKKWDNINIHYSGDFGCWSICGSTTQDGVHLNAYEAGTLYAALEAAVEGKPRLCKDCGEELDKYNFCDGCVDRRLKHANTSDS